MCSGSGGIGKFVIVVGGGDDVVGGDREIVVKVANLTHAGRCVTRYGGVRFIDETPV